MDKTLNGFVVAMEKEARLILDLAEIIEEQTISTKKVFRGKIWEKDFVLIISGIGKVNAALSTQLIIDKFNVDRIINFGVAGGKKGSGLKAGDVVQVDNVCQYDFDLSELDNVDVGYMQDYNLIYYPVATSSTLKEKYPMIKCATGDRFTFKKTYLDIIKNLGAGVVDMECGAIAQVTYANNIPTHIIKLISDVDGCDESIFSQYANNVESICSLIPNALKDIVDNI